MNGIYIKGMEMPNRCVDCPLGIWEDREVMPYCAVTDECFCVNEFIGKRSEDCPLVSVPDHGGLVDANRLIDIALHLMHTAKNDDIANGVKWLWQYILEAPTIIPADKDGAE